MPELPEVETIRAQLEPLLAGRRVVDAGAFDSAKFDQAPGAVGAAFDRVGRRGKYLIASLDDERELVIHLGMTGVLRVRDADAAPDRYVRAWWGLDDRSVFELRDVRRFGRVAVVAAGDYRSLPTLASLGPEPLGDDFTPEGFYRALSKSTARVKTQLLSQRPVAGVGNIYADEALWLAQVYPASRRITRRQASTLHDAVRQAIASGLANGGTTLRDYRTVMGTSGENQHHLWCYGRAGAPCVRCGTILRSVVLDARTTTFCPRCQRR